MTNFCGKIYLVSGSQKDQKRRKYLEEVFFIVGEKKGLFSWLPVCEYKSKNFWSRFNIICRRFQFQFYCPGDFDFASWASFI